MADIEEIFSWLSTDPLLAKKVDKDFDSGENETDDRESTILSNRAADGLETDQLEEATIFDRSISLSKSCMQVTL